jgi:choline-sulfatase
MLYPRVVGLRSLIRLRLLLVVVAAGICSAQTPVILISIDTLRGDRVGVHTPNINAYGAHGTVFTHAETQVPFTLPSHTVLMTSTYPFQNGVEQNAGKVPAGLETLASVMKGHGYQTAAFIGSIFLERQLGLDRGFDFYDSPFSFEGFSKLSGLMLFAGGPRNPYSVRERRPGPLVIRAANQWLSARRGQAVFAFIHLFDVHQPWQHGSYDAEVDSVDKLLGAFQARLKQEGWWDRSLVIVTADHGEGLGEHGESDHGYFVYESTLHVPLIVHWPEGSRTMPLRVGQPVGLIDVAPTILDLLKLPRSVSFKGRSMLDGSARPVLSESTYARDSFGWSALRAVRDGALKYIDAPKPELYNLEKDPGERNNLVRANSADADRLHAELLRLMAAPAKAAATPADPGRSTEVLRSLGYIAPGPHAGASAGSAADPKDKLPELLRYEDALTRMEERRYDSAIAILRSILVTDPHNLLARRDLGVALIEKHEYANAIVELKQVAGSAGDDYVTRYELGIAEEDAGRYKDAADQFETACRIAPGAAQCKDSLDRVRQKIQPTAQAH